MTTLKQIEANRRNAQNSTGPRTEAGKERASRNAVRHGLTAETVIEPLEDDEDYQAFEEAVSAGFDAETTVERELILRLASLLWRLRRATSIETCLFQIGSTSAGEHEQCPPGTGLRSQTTNAWFGLFSHRLTHCQIERNARIVTQRGIFPVTIAPTGRRLRSTRNYCLPSVSWARGSQWRLRKDQPLRGRALAPSSSDGLYIERVAATPLGPTISNAAR